jgi:hypothetical protein
MLRILRAPVVAVVVVGFTACAVAEAASSLIVSAALLAAKRVQDMRVRVLRRIGS